MVKATLIPIVMPEQDVQLTMSMDVARSLKEVVGAVGGVPTGYRGDTSDIFYALDSSGVKSNGSGERRFEGSMTGKVRR